MSPFRRGALQILANIPRMTAGRFALIAWPQTYRRRGKTLSTIDAAKGILQALAKDGLAHVAMEPWPYFFRSQPTYEISARGRAVLSCESK